METSLSPQQLDVWQKISDLEALITKQDPRIPGHVAAIHKNLIVYEELTHLLSDEQIRTLVVAQKQITGQTLAAKVKAVSKKSETKMLKGITADDL